MELVQFETLNRLLAHPGASIELIDDLEILERSRESAECGMLYEISQRFVSSLFLVQNTIFDK